MDARLEWLRAPAGYGAEAVCRMEVNSSPFGIITQPDRYGNRIEYVGTYGADPLVEWARTDRRRETQVAARREPAFSEKVRHSTASRAF